MWWKCASVNEALGTLRFPISDVFCFRKKLVWFSIWDRKKYLYESHLLNLHLLMYILSFILRSENTEDKCWCCQTWWVFMKENFFWWKFLQKIFLLKNFLESFFFEKSFFVQLPLKVFSFIILSRDRLGSVIFQEIFPNSWKSSNLFCRKENGGGSICFWSRR